MTIFTDHLPGLQPRKSLFARIIDARALHKQRRALGNLDAHLLCDIGISRAEAGSEAARPAWDAPSHWVK